ncbi:retrovirus-related pol polyprotein from transposon TNT 1-94 [Tanacetum coccineum]
MSRSTRPGQSPSVFSRLRQEESSSTRQRSPVSTTVVTRVGARDMNIFTRLGERKKDVLRRLGSIFTSVHATTQKLKKDSGKSFSSAWGGQLNAAPVLEMENFTNWKKRNINHVKDSELASLFGKLKYEENLIDIIYETEKNKSLVSATPLSTAFFSTSIVQDFQDSPDDEEDTRSNHECLNDLEEEYHARALLAKSKRFFKKGTQRFSSAKAKDQTECHKCGKKDEEEVSSDDNEMVEVKVLMALAEENDVVSKEGTRNGEWVKISMRKVHTLLEMEDNDDRKTYLDYLCIDLNYVEEQRNNLLSKHRDLVHELNACKEQLLVLKQAKLDFLTMQHVNTEIFKENKNLRIKLKELTTITETWLNMSIPGVERPWLSETEGFILPNHDTADESLVCSTPLPSMKKLDGAEPISGPKTIKSILKSKFTFKAETLKGVIINESSSAPAKDNKSSSASKVNSAHVGKLKSVKIKDDPPLIISLEREINPRNPQHAFKRCKACGSLTHTITDHYDIEWFKRGEALQAKKAKALKSTRAEPSNANRSKTPTRSQDLRWCLEMPGPTCTTEGYGFIKCNGIVFTKVAFVNGLTYNLISISQLYDAKYIVQFDEKRGTIFNFNKEVVMIAPRVRDVYVLDMTSSAQESYFFAKASDNLNWLWHKRLDKPCSSCEKGKHHRASFKTKQTSSIKKCLYLLHMDLFRPVTPRSINHEKYTLVIVDEYSRYTWVYFMKKKSQAPETIMSFIKRVKNQIDIKVKQLKTDNGTEFRNSILVNFCDEKGISQKKSSPYTPEKNGVAERKNRTLIEATRTMLSGSIFSKQYWTEAVATACYTQNRSTIVKRHLKTPYEIFHKRIPNINFLHVFGCPVYIHNHKDHLGKFDEKADDGYLLGYSLVSKAFKVFNTRRQQTKETYHIIFDESPDAIKLSRPSVDNINIAETGRYSYDEYLHPYEPSQRYQTNNNNLSFIEPYECPKPVVLEAEVSSDQYGQADQNDQSAQTDEILNDDLFEHSNHTNDEQIIDNLPNTKDIQILEHFSSPDEEDTSV